MFTKLGVQLYTVRDYFNTPERTEECFKRLAEIGYSEAQTAGYESYELAQIAGKYGISIVGTHYDYNKIINNIDETMKLHEAMGTRNIGIGGMFGAERENYDKFLEFIDEYNKAAQIYAKNGFKLTYHHHSFEFVKLKDGRSQMDHLVEKFDKDNISFVLDTCWLANAGCDINAWLRLLAGRVEILHLKDLQAVFPAGSTWDVDQRLCELGNGNIDFAGVLQTAEAVGVKHLVVEQDDHWIDGDSLKSLEFSKNYISRYMSL